MIDPAKITNFKLSKNQLEEHILFWTLVAGKTATVTAKNLDRLLKWMRAWHLDRMLISHSKPIAPFQMIRTIHAAESKKNPNWLADKMKEFGIGCFNHKSRAFLELADSKLDLRICTAEDLEKIHGIGMKTSRCFIMHSREDSDYAGLDTHVLAFLRDLGHDVPKSTPGSKRKYQDIESKFLFLAKVVSRPPAKFDLLIWRVYSQHLDQKPLLLRAVQTSLKNFKFSRLSTPNLHVFSDGDCFLIAASAEDARKVIIEIHGLSTDEAEEIYVSQMDDADLISIIYDKKKTKKTCREWCKLLGRGFIT